MYWGQFSKAVEYQMNKNWKQEMWKIKYLIFLNVIWDTTIKTDKISHFNQIQEK